MVTRADFAPRAPRVASVLLLCAIPVIARAEGVAGAAPSGTGASSPTSGTDGAVGLDPASGVTATGDATAADGASPATASVRGFEHGLRLGVTLPFGKTGDPNALRSGDLSGVVGVRVPVWLDLGYRLDRKLWVGLGAELGLGTVGSDCETNQECEWSDLRLAAQAHYAFSPGSSSDPWLGLGLGWEWLRGSVTLTVPGEDLGLTQDVAVRAREVMGGPQLVAQGGMRFDVGETLTLGPYLSASASMFLTDSFRCPEGLACPSSGGVEDKQLHAWLGLGIRATHGP